LCRSAIVAHGWPRPKGRGDRGRAP